MVQALLKIFVFGAMVALVCWAIAYVARTTREQDAEWGRADGFFTGAAAHLVNMEKACKDLLHRGAEGGADLAVAVAAMRCYRETLAPKYSARLLRAPDERQKTRLNDRSLREQGAYGRAYQAGLIEGAAKGQRMWKDLLGQAAQGATDQSTQRAVLWFESL